MKFALVLFYAMLVSIICVYLYFNYRYIKNLKQMIDSYEKIDELSQKMIDNLEIQVKNLKKINSINEKMLENRNLLVDLLKNELKEKTWEHE